MDEQSWITTTRQMLSESYGLDCSLKRLTGENRNYLVTTGNQEKYVVKIIAGADAANGIEVENRVLEHAQANGFKAQLPCIIHNTGEQLFTRITIRDEGEFCAQLMGFVEGKIWKHLTDISDGLLVSLGRTMAAFGKAMEGFDDPRLHHSHMWDISRADQHEEAIPLIDDPQTRANAEWALGYWKAQAQPRLNSLPHQIIHGDFNDQNVMIVNKRVNGLVDFMDCCYNPAICELAIGLTYAMFGRPDPLAVVEPITQGYESIRPLSDPEREVLNPLICGRLAMTLCVVAMRRKIDPNHPTWFSSAPGSTALVQQLRSHWT